MFKPVQIETPCSLATPDCLADNHTGQLAQSSYGTLAVIKNFGLIIKILNENRKLEIPSQSFTKNNFNNVHDCSC